MSTTQPTPPRRVRVERNIYRRPDGKLEVGYRDSHGKQRWRVPDFPPTFNTISEARRARDAVLGRKASGQTIKPIAEAHVCARGRPVARRASDGAAAVDTGPTRHQRASASQAAVGWPEARLD